MFQHMFCFIFSVLYLNLCVIFGSSNELESRDVDEPGAPISGSSVMANTELETYSLGCSACAAVKGRNEEDGRQHDILVRVVSSSRRVKPEASLVFGEEELGLFPVVLQDRRTTPKDVFYSLLEQYDGQDAVELAWKYRVLFFFEETGGALPVGQAISVLNDCILTLKIDLTTKKDRGVRT